MIEDVRKRIETAIADAIQDMYSTHLRKMQSDMHLCAVNCCDDRRGLPQIDNVQSCIEDCAAPLLRAQDFIQHELREFQSSLQRCMMQCNEDVRSKIPLKTHESDAAKYRYQFERCTVQCGDKHIGLIPDMMRTIKTVLARGDSLKQA